MTVAPPTAGPGPTITHDPQRLLGGHHRELEAACRALLAYTMADDPRELTLQYRKFESSTLEHLAVEEELLLPGYGEHAPADAEGLRNEHAAIREQLFHLAVDVELHAVRADRVRRLIDTLRAHAAREDAALYPWAQDHLPTLSRRRLFLRIGRSLRSLARSQPPTAA